MGSLGVTISRERSASVPNMHLIRPWPFLLLGGWILQVGMSQAISWPRGCSREERSAICPGGPSIRRATHSSSRRHSG
jgi:hypothetical protein